jgi:tetratricopeptide (TPR) repeat protein
MISVDRNKIAKPAVLDSPEVHEELQLAEKFFSAPYSQRGQRRFEPRKPWHLEAEVRNALIELFHGKCAFCETGIASSQAIPVGRFRPELQTIDKNGELFPDHYWWLMFEWTNLYLMCSECYRMKGTRFPILGPRAKFGERGEALLTEQPLLLDPCVDNPQEHFFYDPEGNVGSSTRQGQITIEVFGLNRHSLIEERKALLEHYRRIKKRILSLVESSGKQENQDIVELLAGLKQAGQPDQPFAGMMSQFLAEWMPSFGDFATHTVELESARQTNDRQAEAVSLLNLGNAALASGDSSRAIDYFEQALSVARETSDRKTECMTLETLGDAYASRKEYQQAIEFYEQGLANARLLEDQAAEAELLGDLGNAFSALGELERAHQAFEQALAVAKQTGDPRAQRLALLNLGNIYAALGEHQKSIVAYQEALARAREAGDREIERVAQGGLGNAYATLGESEKVVDSYQEQKATFRSREVQVEGEITGATLHVKQAAIHQYSTFTKDQESFNLTDNLKRDRYFGRFRAVERVEIENFKVIENLSLDLSKTKTDDANWLMLLGENGSGKSSVLHAVTLALVGDRYRARLPVSPKEVLRYGAESGSVRVYLSGRSKPVELNFHRDNSKFESNPSEPQVLILAYGATRLLPRANRKPKPGTEHAHVDNMFDPFIPLRNATRWLLGLDDPTFQEVARSLKDLLFLEAEAEIIRQKKGKKQEVLVCTSLDLTPIEQLSDGYQSVLAVCADIMAVMLDHWPAMEVAEGLVLIDEIGAHLHPRWRMHIVKSLRKAFKRIQFLVSTHDPLCLRGLAQGEVVVMRRNALHQAVAITDLPPVEGLRVDQLLTSEHFGLSSTIDPEVDALFQEYYTLLAAYSRTPAEDARMQELKTQLAQYNLMGTSRRERMMLEVIDSYLAEERRLPGPVQRKELEATTRRKAREIWASLKQEEGV